MKCLLDKPALLSACLISILDPFGMRRMKAQTQQIGAIHFSVSSPTDAVSKIVELAASPGEGGTPIHFANAYTISLAETDPSYRDVLNGGGITYADGKPISWFSRLTGQNPRLQQVRGPEIFEKVIEEGQTRKLQHFLLGSTMEVLDKLEARLLQRYPEALIAGKLAPPFRPPLETELIERDEQIELSGANIVWVGLGTPKQDIEVARLASSLPVVAVAVGAAFDFSAGIKPVAPAWMSAIGVEWLFRFLCEPRRLWRRYVFGNLTFIKSCWRNRERTASRR